MTPIDQIIPPVDPDIEGHSIGARTEEIAKIWVRNEARHRQPEPQPRELSDRTLGLIQGTMTLLLAACIAVLAVWFL